MRARKVVGVFDASMRMTRGNPECALARDYEVRRLRQTQRFPWRATRALDCFASLAMTVVDALAKTKPAGACGGRSSNP
jgi:hypothetical protein